MLKNLITILSLLTVIVLPGCQTSSPSSYYKYTYNEGNDTPVALAATLFHAIKTNDSVLWDKYRISVSEIEALNEVKSRPISEEYIIDVNEYLDIALADLHTSLELKRGIRPKEMRFLRAYISDNGFDVEDDNANDVIVEFAYQDDYISIIEFDQMIKTERGWVLGLLDGRNTSDIDVGDVLVNGFPVR